MEIGSIQIANTIGLYGLLALIPLLIIYMRKPKPIDQKIPSLMFFMKEKGKVKRFQFFRRLIRSLILLVHIIIIASLAFSIAGPFTDIEINATSKNTVLVIDASASSQANAGGARFNKALDLAKNQLDGSISIILASHIPLVVLKEGSKREAEAVLSTLGPTDGTSNIGDAMLSTLDIMQNKDGKVVVLSDFITTEGPDPLVAKRALAAHGLNTEFISTHNPAGNIGIVDMLTTKAKTKVFIRNYYATEKSVTFTATKDKETLQSTELTIAPQSTTTFELPTPEGITKLEINPNDNFKLDDTVYLSAPESRKVDVLFISNADESYIESALTASPEIRLEKAIPPIIPKINHEVIIMHGVDPNQILPGTFVNIERALDNGSSFIVTAQPVMPIHKLIPIEPLGMGNATIFNLQIYNEFTADIDFAPLQKYLKATAKNNTEIIATAADNSPLMLTSRDGQIVYYGYIDELSDFRLSTSYPIFWNTLVTSLVETEDINDYNFKFDSTLGLQNYKQGIYDDKNRRVSLNLLNEEESDVTKEPSIDTEKSNEFRSPSEIRKDNFDLEFPLIILASVVILLELFYIKRRGEI